MTRPATTIAVDEKPARSGDDPLWDALNAALGTPVEVSLAQVARLDTRRLSILLSAERQWQLDGIEFAVTGIAPQTRDGLARLGLSPTHFDQETA